MVRLNEINVHVKAKLKKIDIFFFKPFINCIFRIQKAHLSYDRQSVVGCSYLTLMTIRPEKKQENKGSATFD